MPLSTNKPGGAGAATASSGEPEHWQAVLPTLTPIGQPFQFCLKAEGDWGSPDGGAEATVRLETERPVQGLPETVTVTAGEPVKIIEGLMLAEECDLSIRVRGPSGSVLAESNPCRLSDAYPYSVRWAGIGEAPGGSDLASGYPGTATDVAVLKAAAGAAPANRSHHFATTGARIFLEAAILDETFTLDLSAASPVERIELRQDEEVVEVMRPFGKRDLGARVRVIWEGAEREGGGPPVRWDGNLYIQGNRIRQAKPINFPPDAGPMETRGDLGVAWKAATNGGFGGLDLWLESAKAGRMEIETPQGRFEILLEDVGLDDMRFDFGGQGKALRVYRLPERLTAKTLKWSRSLAGCMASEGGTRLNACVTFEDGHQAWSSPVYLFRG